MKLSPESRNEVFVRSYNFETKNKQDIYLHMTDVAHDIKQHHPRKGEAARINCKYFE